MRPRRTLGIVALAAALGGVAMTSWPALDAQQLPSVSASPLDEVLNRAFRAVYNLDREEGFEYARRGVAMAPNEARAHRTLASVLWLEILFRKGSVTVDQYLGTITRAQVSMGKPPAELDAECRKEIARAIELAEAAVRRNPRDLDAQYDLGATYGLQASYAASVDGSLTSAFRSAKRAYDAQEIVIDHDPTRVGAGVVLGTYRYVVSGLALPSRMFAYVVGFGGGKERGISMLEAATKDIGAHVDAKTALLIIFSREGRHLDALRVVQELKAEFPRNRVFTLEEGATDIRAGRAADADAVLTQGLTALERDNRPKFLGEKAMWLYKRGLARVNLNRPDDARADLEAALQNEPVEWVKGRIHLELGKVADLAGRRDAALGEYRQAKAIADTAGDPPTSGEAARWLKRPFSFTK